MEETLFNAEQITEAAEHFENFSEEMFEHLNEVITELGFSTPMDEDFCPQEMLTEIRDWLESVDELLSSEDICWNPLTESLGSTPAESFGSTPAESLGGTHLQELENFRPENPFIEQSMDVFEYQGNTLRCAQYAQMFIIEEFLGIELDPDEFCAFSQENGWFNEEVGTFDEDLNKMLDYFGIENEMSYGNDFDQLRECLKHGDRVIVTLDSGEYWHDESKIHDICPWLFGLAEGADHAVEVIGYDEKTKSVILNDSGCEKGQGEMIPLKVFLDAWKDGNNLMVECRR